jgi:hypothetical protein
MSKWVDSQKNFLTFCGTDEIEKGLFVSRHRMYAQGQGGNMAESVNSSDRRRSERVAANRGALAFNGRLYGQIVDASLEGLCFQYISHRKGGAERNVRKCKATGSLDVVFGEQDFTLVGLPVKSIADYQVSSGQEDEPPVHIRRRVVTFEKLSPQELFLLKRFLLLNRYASSRQVGTIQDEAKMDVNYSEPR